VACARIISFHLNWLYSVVHSKLIHALMPWLMHTHAHSVLSGNIVVDSTTPDALRKFVVLTAPIKYGTLFLEDFIFACALIATAAILNNLATDAPVTLRAAATPITSSAKRISIFCFKLLGLSLLSSWITSFLAPFAGSFIDHNGPQKLLFLSLKSQMALGRSPLFINFLYHLWILPITLCVVYVIAPIELHLLQPPDLPPTPNQRKQARLAEIAAAIAISALGIAASAAERNLFQLIVRTDLATYLTSLIASLVRAIPYIPLYIAFYLIANPDNPFTLVPGTSPEPLPAPPQSPPSSTSA